MTKLSKAQVKDMIEYALDTYQSYSEVSRHFGIPSSTVRMIIQRKFHKDVSLPYKERLEWYREDHTVERQSTDRQKRIAYYYSTGMSLQQLSYQFGVSRDTIKTAVRKYGNLRQHFISDDTKKKIIDDWNSGNYNKTQIARKYGYTLPPISRLIKTYENQSNC